MPKSKRSDADQVLEGEILPPASATIATLDEMSPAEFLAQHGIKPPKPKAYRTFAAATRAIITEVVAEDEP
jgi:hypothetical protein